MSNILITYPEQLTVCTMLVNLAKEPVCQNTCGNPKSFNSTKRIAGRRRRRRRRRRRHRLSALFMATTAVARRAQRGSDELRITAKHISRPWKPGGEEALWGLAASESKTVKVSETGSPPGSFCLSKDDVEDVGEFKSPSDDDEELCARHSLTMGQLKIARSMFKQ